MNKPESEMVLVPRIPSAEMLLAYSKETMRNLTRTLTSDNPDDVDPAAPYRAMLEVALAAHPSNQVLQEPIDMVLYCPKCGVQHVDAPELHRVMFEGVHVDDAALWDNPPHKSHLCHGCGHIWRPADVPTNGVAAVKTKGSADSPAAWMESFPSVSLAASTQAVPLLPAWQRLYTAVNELMAVLGAHGTASARDDRTVAVMDALHAIDGGTVLPEQPTADKANLTSASGGDASKTALPDTGDTVYHAPSGEEWVVAYVRGGYLCACGWPESLVPVGECVLTSKATPSQRLDLLHTMVNTDGSRGSYAREQLLRASHEAQALPPGESAGAQPSHKKYLPSMPPPAASLPVSAPAGQEDARDARRYRWLRDMASVKTPHVLNPADGYRCFSAGLDSTLDAAMSATTKEN